MRIKGMIFAAGIGNRLRPITDTCPKALVEVGGIPMLEHNIAKLERTGITEIVVNAHHFAPMIHKFAALRHGKATITVSDESALLLDTGGALAKASGLLADADAVVLINADILTDLNIGEMLQKHLDSGADATLLAWHRNSSRKLLLSGDGCLMGWIDMSTGKTRPTYLEVDKLIPMAFGGVHIISQKIIAAAVNEVNHSGPVFSITPFYVDNASNLDIRAFTPSGNFNWFDIGSVDKLELARTQYFTLNK